LSVGLSVAQILPARIMLKSWRIAVHRDLRVFGDDDADSGRMDDAGSGIADGRVLLSGRWHRRCWTDGGGASKPEWAKVADNEASPLGRPALTKRIGLNKAESTPPQIGGEVGARLEVQGHEVVAGQERNELRAEPTLWIVRFGDPPEGGWRVPCRRRSKTGRFRRLNCERLLGV